MKEVYFGVYIKEFVLFYGEELQYYITEEQENQEQLTENGTILKEEEKEDGRESRYRMINEMAIGQNLQDYSCVKQALKEYWQTEFVADKVFKLQRRKATGERVHAIWERQFSKKEYWKIRYWL